MNHQHGGHETETKSKSSPECGAVADTAGEQGKGLLTGGRILLIAALIAVGITLFLFIRMTVENAQDYIFDALVEFFAEPYGMIAGIVSFLLTVAAYLTLRVFCQNHSVNRKGTTELNIARILTLIVAVIALVAGIAKINYR